MRCSGNDGNAGARRPQPSPAVMVICYGNPLRGDDAAGRVIAERLCTLLADPRVSVTSCHGLVPELAEPVSRAELVVFVDASVDVPPGRLRRLRVRPAEHVTWAQMHHLTPDVLLACARRLFKRSPPRAIVFHVGAESFDHRKGLTPRVGRACERAAERVRELVARALDDARRPA